MMKLTRLDHHKSNHEGKLIALRIKQDETDEGFIQEISVYCPVGDIILDVMKTVTIVCSFINMFM